MNALSIPLSGITLLSIALPAHAQGAIASPNHFSSAEGPAALQSVLGELTTPFRFLQVHDDLQGQPMTITGLAFRPDVRDARLGHSPFSVVYDLSVSTATTTSTTVDAQFANNHGQDKTLVASFQLAQFPTVDPFGPGAEFEYVIPFTTPFVYSGSGPLCWELRVNSTTQTRRFVVDAVDRADAAPAPVTASIGRGCISSSGSRAGLSLTATSDWTQSLANLRYRVFGAERSALASLNIGTSRTFLGSLPLPFELPNTQTAPSRTCTIYNDVLVSVPFLTTASGIAAVNFGVPLLPQFNGIDLFAQALLPSPGQNAFGATTTDQAIVNFVAPYPLPPIGHASGSGFGSSASTTTQSAGAIVRFLQ